MRNGVLAAVFCTAVCGCALDEPRAGTPVLETVARATFEVRLRHTDLRQVTVLFPADTAGAPVGAMRPAVVLVQGGLVKAARYQWLAERLAQAGYVVALPEHLLDLAFFEPDNGHAAQALLAHPEPGSLLEGLVDPERIAVGGHSLGGVVAVKLALAGGFRALFLEASFPDSADREALPTMEVASLSLAGLNDCNAKLDQVTAGATLLPSPTALVVLDGVTHFQFTDSDDEDRARGCASGVSIDTAHDRIASAALAFLDASLGDGGTGADALRQIEGAQVTAR